MRVWVGVGVRRAMDENGIGAGLGACVGRCGYEEGKRREGSGEGKDAK